MCGGFLCKCAAASCARRHSAWLGRHVYIEPYIGGCNRFHIWLQQALYMAATDSISGCNRLYIWLQQMCSHSAWLGRHVYIEPYINGCNRLYIWLQWALYLAAICSGLYIWLQQALCIAAIGSIYGSWLDRHVYTASHVYMAATGSTYGCNRLYVWLQQALYMAAKNLLA